MTPLMTSSIFTGANGTVLFSAKAATFSTMLAMRPTSRCDDGAELLLEFRLVTALLEQRGKGLDRHQGIAQFVRQAGGERAERDELLGLVGRRSSWRARRVIAICRQIASSSEKSISV